ncbi:hypothetical protein [Aquipuribacter sp. SD81]|uniref:hypothetical protein n=1 Tax=Aquipuribacter sp. SD81 TaxID=3127703 RepID=UPI00301783D6
MSEHRAAPELDLKAMRRGVVTAAGYDEDVARWVRGSTPDEVEADLAAFVAASGLLRDVGPEDSGQGSRRPPQMRRLPGLGDALRGLASDGGRNREVTAGVRR